MNNKTKIVVMFTIPDFRGGGAERVFLNLINNINLKLFEVHIGAGKLKGEYYDSLSKKVFLHELGKEGAINSIIPMTRLIWKVKPDVVLSTLGFVVSSSFSSLISPKNIIFISRFGNTISPFLEGIKNVSKINYYLQYLINKAVFFLSDSIIVQSNYMSDDFIKKFSLKDKHIRKITKINNPVDFYSINLSAKISSFPKNLYNINNNNFVFVSVGRLDPQKNFEALLRAFKIVNINYPHSRLIILGEGSCRNDLENILEELQLHDFVDLPGFLANPESIVSCSDYYISSSLFEGVSNSILESLALGIPVIATNCPSGITEVISEGENGYLVSLDGDVVKNLSERMLYVISKDTKINSDRISNRIKEGFDIKNISEEYEALITGLFDKIK